MKTKNAKISVCCILLMLCSVLARADKPKVKGYYIDKAGKRTEGMVEVPTKMMSKKAETIQINHFTFFDKRGRKMELNEETANEFGCTYEGENIVYRVLPEILIKTTHIKAHFYRLIVDGSCAMYLAYTAYAQPTGNTLEYLLYKDESHYHITFTGFTNKIIPVEGRINNLEDFFEDCPELVEKIKQKEFKKGDDRYIRMAQYYNSSCQGASGEGKGEEQSKGEDE